MSKRRWLALAAVFLGVLLIASPQYGVGQNGSKKDFKEKDGNGSKEGPKLAPPEPGVVLPLDLQDAIMCSAEQKKALAELQKEVDGRLAKILTDAQRKQIRDLVAKGKDKDKD